MARLKRSYAERIDEVINRRLTDRIRDGAIETLSVSTILHELRRLTDRIRDGAIETT